MNARRVVNRVLSVAASRWRHLLGALAGTRFIAITGSAGKTTTATLLAAALRVSGRVRHSNRLIGRLNSPRFAARVVLSTTPWHRFCVCEFGTGRPGTISGYVQAVRPDIGVVTHVEGDHYAAFRGLDATAIEKRVLIETLPPEGTAVLNADDPRVAAMRGCTQARVLTFGLGFGADVRGDDVTGAWPERLSLTVRHGTDGVRVATRLVGTHFAHAVLAAITASMAAGVPLPEAARALERVEPAEGRYSVHPVRGVTFIRDDWKAPLWSIPAALHFLESARARRRVAIFGTLSDYPGASAPKYRSVARRASSVAEKVIFVGRMAHSALGARTPADPQRIAVFDTLHALDRHLEAYLQEGDLVLIKGSARADHLQRLVLSRAGRNQCWRPACGRYMFCGDCDLRSRPSPEVPTSVDRDGHAQFWVPLQ